jgi:hypothetical protein
LEHGYLNQERLDNHNYHVTSNNNFTRTLQKILPEYIKTREAAFKDLLQVTKDEPRWKQIVQDYFESCRTTEPEGAPNNNNPM